MRNWLKFAVLLLLWGAITMHFNNWFNFGRFVFGCLSAVVLVISMVADEMFRAMHGYKKGDYPMGFKTVALLSVFVAGLFLVNPVDPLNPSFLVIDGCIERPQGRIYGPTTQFILLPALPGKLVATYKPKGAKLGIKLEVALHDLRYENGAPVSRAVNFDAEKLMRDSFVRAAKKAAFRIVEGKVVDSPLSLGYKPVYSIDTTDPTYKEKVESLRRETEQGFKSGLPYGVEVGYFDYPSYPQTE